MGKVLKVVAVVAIAAAVAYFAPTLAPAFLSHAIGNAAATALVATALSMAASAAMQAIIAAPADAPSGYRRSTMQRDPSGLRLVEVPPAAPEPEALQPIAPRSWRWAFFWPGQRFAVIRLAGDCLAGIVASDARWALVSRNALIRPGDLFAFDLDDLWSAYAPEMRGWRWWHRLASIGMVKRYLGTEREWGRLVFDCTNPPSLCETGFNRVRYAYRVLSWHPTWWRAQMVALRS